MLGVPYTLEIYTGDKRNAGTSARVFVELYGGKDGNETSGRVWLDGGKYERGKKDVLRVDVAQQLSPLSRIDIGHDNSGAGAGWFLDKVGLALPPFCLRRFRRFNAFLAAISFFEQLAGLYLYRLQKA